MSRVRKLATVLGVGTAGAAAIAAARRIRGAATGHRDPGGVVIADVAGYDRHTGSLLGSFYRSVAADVGTAAPAGARVLEVGCGPGHLSVLLARAEGLDVTGLDLDPAMVERARANAEAAATQTPGSGARPAFVVGDVAALPFADGSFDLVVSTLSMHHWADPVAGLAEICRVLRPGGRALVWDLRSGILPFHTRVADPVRVASESPLVLVGASAWAWPWRLRLTKRVELARPDEAVVEA